MDKWKLRAMADVARRYRDTETLDRYGEGYAAGMEDVLRYLAGDTGPTEGLREIFPYGLLEDD